MAYKFISPIGDPDNFVNRYIRYASALTDASYDYHEAMAYFLLSIASQGLRMQLPFIPKGLRGNLYLIQYGYSTVTRKSTCMDIAKDIQERAMPGISLPAAFTPGGLEEELAERSGRPAALFADEFSRTLDLMHNQSFMSGMRGFLLTMYGQDSWQYRRTAKGKKKEADSVEITDSHLCIAGNVTPTLSKYLQPRDVEDGFLARFAIIWPDQRPNRKKTSDFDVPNLNVERNHIVSHLTRARTFARKIGEKMNDPQHPNYLPEMEWVKPEYHALVELDAFQEELESYKGPSDTAMIMSERLAVMAFKLSMLIALGEERSPDEPVLRVRQDHAAAAVNVIRKWREWSVAFATSLYESAIEKHIRRVEAMLIEHGPEMARWDVAKRMKLSKRELDEVQMTMCDRGMIRLAERVLPGGKKNTLIWMWQGGYEEAKIERLEKEEE